MARAVLDRNNMEATKMILVPVDFQDASLAALEMAREFADRLGWEVALLHTYAIPIAIYPGLDPVIAPSLPEDLAAAAKTGLAKLAAGQGVQRTYLRAGDPATEILAAIDELAPAMVAMGTHGRTGLAHLLLGSVTETIVQKSPVPVLTVHAKQPS